MHDAVRPKVVVGLGYGDEGKGMTTGFLAEQLSKQGKRPLVIPCLLLSFIVCFLCFHPY